MCCQQEFERESRCGKVESGASVERYRRDRQVHLYEYPPQYLTQYLRNIYANHLVIERMIFRGLCVIERMFCMPVQQCKATRTEKMIAQPTFSYR